MLSAVDWENRRSKREGGVTRDIKGRRLRVNGGEKRGNEECRVRSSAMS